MARTLADAPVRVLLPVIYSIILFKTTGQPEDSYRLLLFCLLNMSVSFVAQAKGMLFGGIFVHSIAAAVTNACISVVPFLLLAGIFVTIKSMNQLLQVLSIFSYFRVSQCATFGQLYP